MNALRSRHKQCHFNRTKSPLYLVKLKMAQNGLPQCVLLNIEPIVPNLRRKSFSVPLVSSQLVRKFFQQASGRNILHSRGFFIINLSSNSIWLIFACELKLNCPDLRRITVMTLSSN